MPHAAGRILPDSYDANEIDHNDAADSNAINAKFESLRIEAAEKLLVKIIIFESINKQFWGCIAAALLGWYLLIPPPTCKVGVLPCTQPLSKWSIGDGFDTAAGCTAQHKHNISASAQMLAQAKSSPELYDVDAVEEINWSFLAQVCASSDDPRLAK